MQSWGMLFDLTKVSSADILQSHADWFWILMLVITGLTGALIANTTGAGGGIIFIPVFSLLGLNPLSAVGTSLGIQCLGMSAGSLGWLMRNQQQGALLRTGFLCSFCALVGALAGWVCQAWLDGLLALLFGTLSILVALVSGLLIQEDSVAVRDIHFSHLLALAAFIGGFFTFFVSIGIGELVLLAAVFSGLTLQQSISLAVVSTSMTVIPLTFLADYDSYIIPALLIPIGLGAIIGGGSARYIVEWLGAKKVKSFCVMIIGSTGVLEIHSWHVGL